MTVMSLRQRADMVAETIGKDKSTDRGPYGSAGSVTGF